MKLYKFRPLADHEDLKQVQDILKTNCFWCSKFSELNDPMEGVFYATDRSLIEEIYKEKNDYKICSFSTEVGFKNPTMWGYYANGFKGVAIEIEIAKAKVEIVDYKDEILSIKNISPGVNIAKKILTTKLKCWENEMERRFLTKSQKDFQKIGKITAVYYGEPYNGLANSNSIKSESIEKYNELKNQLKKAMPMINFYPVKIESGEVAPDIKIPSQRCSV